MLATDLIGLGETPAAARRSANGGTGPVSVVAKGSTYDTSLQLFCCQYVTYVASGSGSFAVGLPVIGGDNGALVADDYVIHNGTASSVNLFVPPNHSINIGGQSFISGQAFTLTTLKTVTCYAAIVPSSTVVGVFFGLSN